MRVAMAWRARWLCNYAMSGSKVMACRAARAGHSTVDYHLKNDLDFATQADSAKEHAIDLLRRLGPSDVGAQIFIKLVLWQFCAFWKTTCFFGSGLTSNRQIVGVSNFPIRWSFGILTSQKPYRIRSPRGPTRIGSLFRLRLQSYDQSHKTP
jgi:hypothetical protein